MRDRYSAREPAVYAALVIALQAAYLVGAATYPSRYFGFNQLGHFGVPAAIAVLAGAWFLGLLPPLRPIAPGGAPSSDARRSASSPTLALLVACAGTLAFLLLRSRVLNPDGVALLEKIPQDLPVRGAHLTHDELLELYVHSRLFYHAHHWFGWSVAESYQVASAVSGGVFLFVLVLLARRLSAAHRFIAISLVLSGGYVQLFFGDVENYTLVTTLLLLYLALAHLYLERRVPLWLPSLTLSAGIGFHVLAGWMLPSLVFLFLQARARGETGATAAGAVALVVPLAGLLAYFHFHGLPIERLFDSSHISGMGGHYDRYIAPLRIRYFGGMINVVCLLLPAVVVLPALAAFRRLGSDPYSQFLTVAAISTLVFTFLWRAQLGVREDWNLYAPGMVPVALLISRSLASIAGDWRMRRITTALAATAAAHSIAWVLANHFRWR